MQLSGSELGRRIVIERCDVNLLHSMLISARQHYDLIVEDSGSLRARARADKGSGSHLI